MQRILNLVEIIYRQTCKSENNLSNMNWNLEHRNTLRNHENYSLLAALYHYYRVKFKNPVNYVIMLLC